VLTLIANEILKLRTARAPWLILLAQQAVIGLGISGIVATGKDLTQPQAGRILLCHAGLSSLFVLVLGIMAVAGEYRDGTITDTFMATPRRARVIAAKLVTYTALGVLSGIMSAVTALAVTGFWFSAKGATLDPASEDVWRTLAGIAVWMPIYAAIGVGLGAAVRNLAAAVAVALAWIALVEGIMMNLLGDLGRWLPLASGMALGNVPQANLLPQLTGGLVLAGYAATFGVLAVVLTTQRDVT
jgi:ABC-2 type transport system permease protein